ncbi:MAG: arsenate reductase family protein [Sulfuricurvum sp.]
MLQIYGIKNCGSVKKALQFFDTHDIPYVFHDFKTAPVNEEKILSWLSKSNLSVLLNTKGTTYRTLNLKALALNDNEKIRWMEEHNLLIKRPVIEYGDQVIVGYEQSHYEGIFLS